MAARSREMVPSWPNEDDGAPNRLELACTRFLTSVSEIAAKIEYIDLKLPPDHTAIAKTGGYPARAGIETDGTSGITPHNPGIPGAGGEVVAIVASILPHHGVPRALR